MKILSKLTDVYESYRKWMHIEDTKHLDLLLALNICRQIHVEDGGKPVWIIFVAPSASGKSDLFNPILRGLEKTTFDLPKITSNTIVTGYKDGKDLAPELNHKLVILPDYTRIATQQSDAKREIFSQFRDLYDGFASKRTGGIKSEKYSNLRVTMLIGATPEIYKDYHLLNELGTRFLIYFYKPPAAEKAQMKILERMCKGNVDTLKGDTGKAIKRLILSRIKERSWKKVELTKDVIAEIQRISNLLPIMRATAPIDQRTREPKTIPNKEEPTRIFESFLRLYPALMSLDESYPESRALAILEHISISSGNRVRGSVLKHLERNPTDFLTTAEIARSLRIGLNTVKPQCHILWYYKVIDRETTSVTDSLGREREADAWKLAGRSSELPIDSELDSEKMGERS